ncbi:MAG TPA: adenylate/guanylate cyclase domain-containing protein [Candidatus Nitrosocosmicus sp.]|nr:adenylate/guanylate cyclase domain-containing protein [Candidatus Nitrosocosmicus sp.]
MKHFPGNDIIGKNLQRPDFGVYLISGPKVSGKLHYCNNFILNGLTDGVFCICISSSFIEKKYKSIFFPGLESLCLNLKVLNPYTLDSYDRAGFENSQALTYLFEEVRQLIDTPLNRPVYLVLSSLTNFLENFSDQDVTKFVTSLVFLLKNHDVNSIFTIDNTDPNSSIFVNKIAHLFDGLFETKLPLDSSLPQKYIKLVSMFGNNNFKSDWINYTLDNNNIITSISNQTRLICNLCKDQINESPVFYQELAFHQEHLTIYMKLVNFYGNSKIAEFGSSGILYTNFFFIDIVGLSDPSLSVKNQIEKIQILNNLINSCNSYKKDREKKILPTGDGMAIGFLTDPKLPVELSLELHKKLGIHNSNSSNQSGIQVRIGIGSGHVFIVNDLNDNQNLWGPGIILARRVMDLGDQGHILIEGGFANNLFSIDNELRKDIHFLGNYSIKHNQKIDVYSLYNQYAGNAEIPQKFLDIRKSV